MKKLFFPQMYIKNYKNLDINLLKQKGIKVLICDIDNTLAPHDIIKPSEDTIDFLKMLQAKGFDVAIVSNNTSKRVKLFTENVDVYYVSSAKKPLPFAYKKIAKHFNQPTSKVAMMGDQIMTDILGANFAGCFSILSSPLVMRDIPITRFNRKIENRVIDYLEKTTSFKKGAYYNE